MAVEIAIRCARAYTDDLSEDEQEWLEGKIQDILSCSHHQHAVKLLYLILIEWGEWIRPNPHMRSMMGMYQKLVAFLYQPYGLWLLRDGLTAPDVLHFCIQEAFPHIIHEEALEWQRT